MTSVHDIRTLAKQHGISMKAVCLEAKIRNVANFSRFLESAAFSNGEMVNYTNIASDCGVEFSWGVKLSKRYSFDLFTFLQQLNDLIDVGDADAVYDHVQNATLMMVNASDDELEPFIEEMVVAAEMDDVLEGVEKLLKENNDQS